MSRNFVRSVLCAGMLFFVPVVLSQAGVCQAVYAAEYDADTIASVQNALNDAGYDCGTADGVAGTKTHEAIQQYQEAKGLNASGDIDDELLDSLGISSGSDRPTGDESAEEESQDEAEGTEKGDRGNPYEFGEDIPLGHVYANDEWIDMSICFDSVLKPRQVLTIDLEDSLERNFYAKATLKVNETSAADDEKVKFGLDANYYTSDMSERNVWFYDAAEKSSLSYVYSYCDYELNVICPTDQSYDKNMKFIELLYKAESDTEAETSVWVRIPEYWNGEEAGASAANATEEAEAAEDTEGSEEAGDSQNDEMVDGMRVSFKEAMDSYEEFFDEYCDFMEKYQSSDGTSLSLLADYASFMAKYSDTMKKFEAWESEDMNTTEAAYYLEVSSRILNRLAEVNR